MIDCKYCLKPAELVTGLIIYPHRKDLKSKKFWQCTPCDAYVGCHPKTEIPLGDLANKELREWRKNAHSAFDPIWFSKVMSRTEAYAWLGEKLKLTPEETHIGMFDIDRCKQAIAHAKTIELPPRPEAGA